ncbi:hypothetical protein B296_00033975 [Ensete ventricosum]|uniref:Uncharacterized protein n=1 Tax=Ensete ventricosum TaxID=4639 RepID=A0A426X796_ENSVE|nr:hypothetical protein B296_00033975 [Ensete ventricosum]
MANPPCRAGHPRLAPISTAHCQRSARKGLLAHGEAAGVAPVATIPQRGGAAWGHDPVRRGSSGNGAEGEYGVRASFREKDDPARMNSEIFEDCDVS